MPETNSFSRKFKFSLSGALIFLLLAAACKTETASPVEMGYFYFPAEVGTWVIYDVDSVVYDDFTGEVYTYNYQVKEISESIFTDGEGQPSLRIERYTRPNAETPWTIHNVWQARRLPTRAEKTEENVTYIKLAFPVRQNHTWDGNAYNSNPPLQYRYTAVHEPMQIGQLAFDSTITVQQKQLFTLISEDLQQEIFAREVGMIYKKYKSISKEIDGTIISGVDFSYSISAFGRE